MIKIIVIPFMFFTCVSFSQFREAKIIFNDTTSIIGFGEIKNNKILFKVELKDQPSEWNYEMARGIIYSGYGYSEKYEFVKLSKQTKPKLLEVIDEGKVNLYKMPQIVSILTNYFPNSVGYGSNSAYTEDVKYEFYVKRDNEEYPTHINLNFKPKAIKYFSDCKIICDKINQRIFNKETIEEMVNHYNNYCFDEPSD